MAALMSNGASASIRARNAFRYVDHMTATECLAMSATVEFEFKDTDGQRYGGAAWLTGLRLDDRGRMSFVLSASDLTGDRVIPKTRLVYLRLAERED